MPSACPTRKPAGLGRRLVQLTLDFFKPDRPAGPASADKVFDYSQKLPDALVDSDLVAMKNVADQPPPYIDKFVHPRASRQGVLDGRLVAYEVKRGKRRTIGFGVGSEGLTVSVPSGLRLSDIDRAVQAKSSWILKKLADTRERHRQTEAARIDWKEGARFSFLGQPVQVVLAPGQGQAALNGGSADAVRQLRLPLPANAPPEKIEQAVRAWLMLQARQIFTARLDFFAPQLGVQWRSLGLSNARTRWGSASSGGAIRLNWRLVYFSPQVLDYVVVHELSHLRVMDHSARFWATVESVLPGHALLRRQLKMEVMPR